MQGYVRVGNKRIGSLLKPVPGEIIIQGDRTNPILGNPFILKDHRNLTERAEVIRKFDVLVDQDWQKEGPIFQETHRIAELVKSGERVILMCWCAGPPNNYDCHLNIIKDHIQKLCSVN